MIRKSHLLLALALVAAAVAAPIAQSATDPNGNTVADPLAVSYLRGHGYSPGQIKVMVGQADPLAISYRRNHGFPQAQATAAPTARKAIDPLAVSYLRGQGMSPGEITAATEGVDPLAASYLRGQGLSPSQIVAWTSGVCSGADRPAACFQGNALGSVEAKVDPLAVSYLTGQGLSPREVTSWTVGACSHETRAASCYAMFRPAATSFTQVTGSTGFQWGDAGIGAGFTLGIILLLGGVGAGLFISRRNGRHQPARA
jgi:hypothetical protein